MNVQVLRAANVPEIHAILRGWPVGPDGVPLFRRWTEEVEITGILRGFPVDENKLPVFRVIDDESGGSGGPFEQLAPSAGGVVVRESLAIEHGTFVKAETVRVEAGATVTGDGLLVAKNIENDGTIDCAVGKFTT